MESQPAIVVNLPRPDQQSRTPVRQAQQLGQVSTVEGCSSSETTSVSSESKVPNRASLLASPNGNVTIEDGQFNATGRDHINITVITGKAYDGKAPRENVSERQRKEESISVNDVNAQAVQNTEKREETKKELSEGGINGSIWSSRTPKQCAIYVQNLLPEGHGWPLYIPGPNKRLPEAYRKKGMQIGDVGIINIRGYFDFLFNICHPADHPINYQGVPKNFKQLQIEPTDIQEHSDFNGESYISSSSVTNSSGLKFESLASEGAILAMPDGASSEDVGNEATFQKYMSIHAEDWYKYINNIRGRDTKNGDVRLVIGYHKTSRWCIATFSDSTVNRNPFILELNPVTETNVGKIYEWKHSGTAVVRTGPGTQELEDLRKGDPDHERTSYQNQSLFVRSISALTLENAWNTPAAEPGEVEIEDDTRDHAFPESPGQSSTGSRPSNSSTISSTSTSANVPGLHTALASINNISIAPLMRSVSHQETIMPDHPSDVINKMLLKLSPNARVAITSDNDWISVLRKDDLIFPSNDELCSRIKASLVIRQDKDVVFLERPDSATSTSPCIEDETEEGGLTNGPSTPRVYGSMHPVSLDVMPTRRNEVTVISESMPHSKRGSKINESLSPTPALDNSRSFRARQAHLQALEQRLSELETENNYFRQIHGYAPSSRPPSGREPTGLQPPFHTDPLTRGVPVMQPSGRNDPQLLLNHWSPVPGGICSPNTFSQSPGPIDGHCGGHNLPPPSEIRDSARPSHEIPQHYPHADGSSQNVMPTGRNEVTVVSMPHVHSKRLGGRKMNLSPTTSPFLDSFDPFQLSSTQPTVTPLPTKATAARRKVTATGIREGVTPDTLLDESATTQSLNCVTPSATSSKDVPAVFVKRARSTAFGDEEDQLDDYVLPPDPTEKDLVEQKRRNSIIATRRYRKRKLEHLQLLETSLEKERQEKERWRERAHLLSSMLTAHSHQVPDFSLDES